MQKVPDEQKELLLAEFNSIKKVSEKFEFWKKRLDMDYILFLFLESPYYERTDSENETVSNLRDFTILPSRNEFEEYNRLVWEQYKRHSDEAGYSVPLYDLQKMIDRIKTRIENSKKKDINITHELHKIRSIVEEKGKEDKLGFFFSIGYERQLLHDKEPFLGAIMCDYIDLSHLRNGSTLAKYNEYLVSQLEPSSGKEQPKKRITLPQQILLLQFVSKFEKIDAHPTMVDKAIFLSELLNKSPQNIRELYAEGIHTFLTPEARKNRPGIEKDLRVVHKLLLSVGLTEEANQVKKELDSL